MQAVRGLYADGSFYLLYTLHNDDFFHVNPTRYFAEIVTQLPVVVAMHSGVSDTAMLIRLHSVGLVVIPLGLWVGALMAQWRRPMLWALVAMFAVTQLNSGFMAIGEYNLAYALVVLSAALLLRARALRWWQLVVLVTTAVLATLSYEALVYLGPVLIALAVARLMGVRGIGAARSWAERAALILLCVVYTAATAVAAWSIRDPRVPEQGPRGRRPVDAADPRPTANHLDGDRGARRRPAPAYRTVAHAGRLRHRGVLGRAASPRRMGRTVAAFQGPHAHRTRLGRPAHRRRGRPSHRRPS